MGLLFERYTSPFLMIDNYLKTNLFADFVLFFIEEINEKLTWDFYLHKVQGMSFNEFKESVRRQEFTEEQLETTISDSKNIMANFIPEERG